MVSSTLVNVADDAELRVVTLLCGGESASFHEACTNYLSEGDMHKLLTTILSTSSTIKVLLQIENIHEVVACVSIFSTMVKKLDSFELVKNVLKLLVDAIRSDPQRELKYIERKVTIASVLYNMMERPYKCMLLECMIQLAGNSTEQSLLKSETTLGRLLLTSNTGANASACPPIVAMLQSWNVTSLERRSMYTAICNALSPTDIRKQRFLLLLIETYSDTGMIDETGVAVAKEVAIGAIRDPITLFRFQRDLLSRPAIQLLQQKDGALFALLKVFQEGTISDYESFILENGGEEKVTSLLAQWGIDIKNCVRCMRIFSLCTLSIEKDVITYQEIATTLQLHDSDQVESWVIAAVNSGLLQAKMDQLKEIVMVERCVVRKFDINQWKRLQDKLSSWKDHVGNILGALKQSERDTFVSPPVQVP